jgi:hypothetical protein
MAKQILMGVFPSKCPIKHRSIEGLPQAVRGDQPERTNFFRGK